MHRELRKSTLRLQARSLGRCRLAVVAISARLTTRLCVWQWQADQSPVGSAGTAVLGHRLRGYRLSAQATLACSSATTVSARGRLEILATSALGQAQWSRVSPSGLIANASAASTLAYGYRVHLRKTRAASKRTYNPLSSRSVSPGASNVPTWGVLSASRVERPNRPRVRWLQFRWGRRHVNRDCADRLSGRFRQFHPVRMRPYPSAAWSHHRRSSCSGRWHIDLRRAAALMRPE